MLMVSLAFFVPLFSCCSFAVAVCCCSYIVEDNNRSMQKDYIGLCYYNEFVCLLLK